MELQSKGRLTAVFDPAFDLAEILGSSGALLLYTFVSALFFVRAFLLYTPEVALRILLCW